MKQFNKPFLMTLGLGLLAGSSAYAQTGVGTGSTAPRTMLDVNGAIAVTETTAAVSGNAATVPTSFSLVRLTGSATATVTLTAAASPAPVAGQQLVVYNTTTQPATFAGQSIAAGQTLAFVYSGGGWQATTGGSTPVTASNGLTKTGNDVALGGTLTKATDIATAGNNLTVSGTGNVGIGTTTPASTLDVAGAVTYRAGTALTVSGTTVSIAALTNSQFVLTGSPTAAFVVTGPTTSNGSTALQPGARMALVNNTGQQATLNKTTIPAGQAVDFTYSGGAWVATNSYSTTSQAMFRANTAMSGGGTTTFIGNNLAWDQRFIVMNNGNGSHFSTSGFFDITMPPTGTVIPGVGGSADVTTTAAGIPLTGWQALYYVLPIGNNSGSIAASFRIVGFNSAFVIPENWVMVAARNDDNGTVKLGTEQILYATQSSNGCLPTQNQTVASGATTTYTLSKTQGILTIAGDGNACTRYWVAYVAYNTRTNVLTLAPGSYGNPDAPSASPASGQSIQIQNSALGCADGQAPNQPGLFSLNGQTLTYTNQRNVSINMSVRECDANASNQSASVQNIYSTDGTLTANRTVTQGSNSLTFSGTGNLVKTGGGYVGIGTATPGVKLDIVIDGSDGIGMDDTRISTYGTPSITNYTLASRGTVAVPANLQANDLLAENTYQGRVNGGFTTLSNIAHRYTGNGTTALSDMRFSTSNAERLRISDAGNVGIGTTAPFAPLQFGNGLANRKLVLYDVNNSATVTNDHQFYGLGVQASTLRYQVDRPASDHVFYSGIDATSSKELMRVTGDGKVGIGASDPGEALEINGNIRLGSEPATFATGWGSFLEFDGNGVGTDVIGLARYNTAANNTELRMVVGDDPAAPGTASADRFVLGTTSAFNGPGQVASGTFSPKFYVYSNGATGIGIDPATTNLLDVAGTAGTSNVRLASLGGTGTRPVQAAADGTLSTYTPTAATTPNIYTADGTLTGPRTLSGITAANTLSFRSASAVDAAITVGGTGGDAGRLQLGNANHGIQRNLTGSTGGASNDVAVYTSGTNASIHLVANPSISANTSLPLGQFTLTPSGNIGIGTTTPGTKLDIVVNNSDGGGMDDTRISTYGTPSITNYTLASRGTVAAPANLQTNDLLADDTYQGRVNGGFAALSGIRHTYTGNGTTALSDMRFTTSGGERLRIDQNGYVGIGTTTPVTPLEVNGVTTLTFQTDNTFSNGVQVRKRGTNGNATAAVVNNSELGYHSYLGWDGTAYGRGAFDFVRTTENWTTSTHGANYAIYTTPNGSTANIERLRVEHNGNVGIGTTAPSTTLQVNGTIKAGTDATGNARLTPSGTGNAGYLEIYKGDGTTRLGYIGYDNTNLNYVAENGAIHNFIGGFNLRSTAASPVLGITTTTAAIGGIPANSQGNVYYEVAGNENHVFGGNVVSDSDNGRSLGLSTARWAVVYAANGTIQTSDQRLKTNIENSGYGLKDVLKMHPVTYNWKSEPGTNHMVGFIAQEMEKIVPEAVVAPKAANEYYGMKYEELIPVLTKAIQEQQQQIEGLKVANAKLQVQADGNAKAQAELQDVKASLESLSAIVKQLQAGGTTASAK